MGFWEDKLIQVQFTIENEHRLHATCNQDFHLLVFELSENKC